MSSSPSAALSMRTALLLVFASPSRLLLLFLLLANRAYLASFLEAGTRQLGLLALGVIVLLSIASYLVTLGSLRLRRSGRTGPSIAAAVFAFVALELPACLLLLLTPAGLTLMRCFTQGDCPAAPPIHPIVSILR